MMVKVKFIVSKAGLLHKDLLKNMVSIMTKYSHLEPDFHQSVLYLRLL